MTAQVREKAREEDPELMKFARRVGIVATAAIAVVALSQMLFAEVTRDIRAGALAESRARLVADSLQTARSDATDRRLDRMAAIMELMVFVVSDQTDREARSEALKQLRQMRKLSP